MKSSTSIVSMLVGGKKTPHPAFGHPLPRWRGRGLRERFRESLVRGRNSGPEVISKLDDPASARPSWTPCRMSCYEGKNRTRAIFAFESSSERPNVSGSCIRWHFISAG